MATKKLNQQQLTQIQKLSPACWLKDYFPASCWKLGRLPGLLNKFSWTLSWGGDGRHDGIKGRNFFPPDAFEAARELRAELPVSLIRYLDDFVEYEIVPAMEYWNSI